MIVEGTLFIMQGALVFEWDGLGEDWIKVLPYRRVSNPGRLAKYPKFQKISGRMLVNERHRVKSFMPNNPTLSRLRLGLSNAALERILKECYEK